MRGRIIESLILFFVIVFVYFGVFYPTIYHILHTPKDTYYTLAQGYTFDYYQYTAWIKEGMRGQLLLTTPYTEENYSPVFIHPFFPLLGLVSSIFRLSPFLALIFAHAFALGLFLTSFYLLVRKTLEKRSARIVAYILFLSSCNFWSTAVQDKKFILIEPLSWVQNFNVIGKYALAPHHLLALSLFILVFLLLTGKYHHKLSLPLAVILGIFVGFLNPSTLLFLLIILLFSCLLLFIFHSPFSILHYYKKILVFTLFTSPVLFYHFYIFQYVLPWSYMYTLMRGFNPHTTLLQYLAAIGPILPFSLMAFFSRVNRRNLLMTILSVWAYLPFLIYLMGSKILPFNSSRLFQSAQFIPLAILAALGIDVISQKLAVLYPSYSGLQPEGVYPERAAKRIRGVYAGTNQSCFSINRYLRFFYILPALGFLFYAIVPYKMTIEYNLSILKPNHFNIFVPNSMLKSFDFLDKNSPVGSVVLAGESLSTMLPSFTHNRTILGRDDSSPNYYPKRDQAYLFLEGKMKEEEAFQFLRRYNISYIYLGYDALRFADLPIRSYPFLKEIYRDGPISIVQFHPN